MGLLILFLEFFKIGLFSFGGGLATLPFLYQLADKYDWFTYQMIGNMIAISESTPGPMGINMATYTGFQNAGIIGGLISTAGLVTPSIIVIILVSKVLEKFRTNPYVEKVFSTLRPTVTGMIGAVGFSVIVSAVFHTEATTFWAWVGIKELLLFALVLVLTKKTNFHPILYIVLAAVIGVVFQF